MATLDLIQYCLPNKSGSGPTLTSTRNINNLQLINQCLIINLKNGWLRMADHYHVFLLIGYVSKPWSGTVAATRLPVTNDASVPHARWCCFVGQERIENGDIIKSNVD